MVSRSFSLRMPRARAECRPQAGCKGRDGVHVDARCGDGVAFDRHSGGDARRDEATNLFMAERQAEGGRETDAIGAVICGWSPVVRVNTRFSASKPMKVTDGNNLLTLI